MICIERQGNRRRNARKRGIQLAEQIRHAEDIGIRLALDRNISGNIHHTIVYEILIDIRTACIDPDHSLEDILIGHAVAAGIHGHHSRGIEARKVGDHHVEILAFILRTVLHDTRHVGSLAVRGHIGILVILQLGVDIHLLYLVVGTQTQRNRIVRAVSCGDIVIVYRYHGSAVRTRISSFALLTAVESYGHYGNKSQFKVFFHNAYFHCCLRCYHTCSGESPSGCIGVGLFMLVDLPPAR